MSWLSCRFPNACPRFRSEEHTSELQSPRSTLFPYTTLFRSDGIGGRAQEEIKVVIIPLQLPCLGFRAGFQMRVRDLDRKSTRLNSSHRDLHSFPTRRSSDLMALAVVLRKKLKS